MLLREFQSLPRAHGNAVATGRIRVTPDDFVVREWLGFEPDDAGDHLLVIVRKRGANTQWVARELARRAGIHPRDVGFAGIKDRNAVTEQAFTLPGRTVDPADWLGFTGEGFEVIRAHRQRRKLKRGAHKGNDFRILVRDVHGDPAALDERLTRVRQTGVPNYFGPQRFGRDGSNLRRAERWFDAGEAPYDRIERGFALSAARAALFNTVLAARVRAGTWNLLQSGDVANLDGSGSIFAVDAVDAVLLERCERLDIHPTGPLMGKGQARTGEQVARFEAESLVDCDAWIRGLEAAGLEAERRALRIAVQDLRWTLRGTELELEFRLGKGSFATAVLAEIISPDSAAQADTDDD